MEQVQSALVTWCNGLVNQYQDILIMMLPIALGIIGLVMAAKFGIRFFQSMVYMSGGHSEMSDNELAVAMGWDSFEDWDNSGLSGWYDDKGGYHDLSDADDPANYELPDWVEEAISENGIAGYDYLPDSI